MLKRASVKLSLFSVVLLLLIVGCGVQGGGDAYRSIFHEYANPDYYGGLEVSSDRKSIRIFGRPVCGGVIGPFYSPWVSISSGGSGEFSYTSSGIRLLYRIEIRNSGIRLGFYSSYSNSWVYGNWAPLCRQTGGISEARGYRIETTYSGGKYLIRACKLYYFAGTWVCGNWVEYVCGPSCPQGYTYNPSRNVCEADPYYSCPTGYVYNPSSGKCESSQINYSCPPGGTYSPPDNLCVASVSNWTCPYAGRTCYQDADNRYYCSPYDCYDASTIPPTNTDTQQGANDIPADGTVDENGCDGTVYIFNGRDMRCRPPGTQTGFSNCCKKTKTWFGLGSCNETEKQLASLRSWGKLDGNCHYVGSYCAEKWLGTCVQRKKTYCCFSSPLARIIHEQGRPQLGIGWGTPESPNCRGFTAQEFQKLDFSRIDFSEWIEEEVGKNVAPQIQQNISNVVNQLPSQIQSQ